MNEVQYFGNFMDDAVVKITDNPDVRVVKDVFDNTLSKERSVGINSKIAFGGESFAYYHILEPITKEEYETFGVTWIFGESESERVKLDKPLSIETS